MKAIKKCLGLPLAITIIGGLRLRTNEEWEKVVDIVAKTELQNKPGNYEYSLHKAITLSIEQLDPQEQKIFRLLGVYRRIPIPLESIMTLWDYDLWHTKSILQNLSSKSLIKYQDQDG